MLRQLGKLPQLRQEDVEALYIEDERLQAEYFAGIAMEGKPVISRIDAPASQAIVDELCDKLPDFRAAYRDDGLTIDEFGDFAPLQFFRNMFVKGWDALADEVGKQRAKVMATA